MILLKLLVFIVFLLSASLALIINKDVFSPAKWFVLHFSVYFFDIYTGDYSAEVHLLALLMIFIILTFVLLDRPYFGKSNVFLRSGINLTFKVHLIFYLLLLVPIIAQLYMVYIFGGVDSYINIIKMRVLEFRGLGPLIMLTKIYYPVLLVYFGFMLSLDSKSKDWFVFFIALVGMILLSLMSGGRGAVLAPILAMVVIYHFIKRDVGILFILVTGVVLVFSAATMEILRNQVSVVDGELIFFAENDSPKRSYEFTKYGLISPKLIMDNSIDDYEYGATYLTIVTNFIPRSIWPGKPDTGGVVLTNRYMPNVWNGSSNLATGVAAEAMLNFGEAGLLLVPFQMMLMFLVLRFIYCRIYKNKYTSVGLVKVVLVYIFASMAFSNLISGEFTNVMMGLVINLFFLFFVFNFLRLFYGKRLQ